MKSHFVYSTSHFIQFIRRCSAHKIFFSNYFYCNFFSDQIHSYKTERFIHMVFWEIFVNHLCSIFAFNIKCYHTALPHLIYATATFIAAELTTVYMVMTIIPTAVTIAVVRGTVSTITVTSAIMPLSVI